MQRPIRQENPPERCSHCLKQKPYCICKFVSPTKTKTHLLILQHPQEQDEELGTARLAHLSLPNSTLRIGLSWRNLQGALGREADPKRWAVLYLGSVKGDLSQIRSPLFFVDKQSKPLHASGAMKHALEGVVVLDGTWSQAKALWWRNAWLLKLHRMALKPEQTSLYGKRRKQPRKEALSTIEAVALCLSILEDNESIKQHLMSCFQEFLTVNS